MDDEKHDPIFLNRTMLNTALRAEEVAGRERDQAAKVRMLEPDERSARAAMLSIAVQNALVSLIGVAVLLAIVVAVMAAINQDATVLSWLGVIAAALVVLGAILFVLRRR